MQLSKPLQCLFAFVTLSVAVSAQADEKKSCPWPGSVAREASSVGVYKTPNVETNPADSPAPLDEDYFVNNTPVFYVKPGLSACGETYRDSSMVACISPGYALPEGSKRGGEFPCDLWVEVNYNRKTIQARVQDKCPGAGCDGIYLSREAFSILGSKEDLESGQFPKGTVTWKFLDQAPWWSCLSGLPGRTISGQRDNCKGPDSYGCERKGRLTGSDRITGPKVYGYCEAYERNPPCSSPKDGAVGTNLVCDRGDKPEAIAKRGNDDSSPDDDDFSLDDDEEDSDF